MEQLNANLLILGLAPEATLQEAESAYRDLIRVWHPDRFVSDPRLRAKAEEQTVRINRAMRGVREALRSNRGNKRPSTRAESESPPNSRAPQQAGYAPNEPTHSHPTLVIHQPLRSSLLQLTIGCASVWLGLTLASHFSQRSGVQTALGLIIAAHGVSVSLMALATALFKPPMISVNRRTLQILGAPPIPTIAVSDAQVLISRRGTSLAITCSPEFVQKLPLLPRLSLRVRHLLRGAHFDLNSNLLSDDPGHVIRMIAASLQLTDTSESPTSPPRQWATYTNLLATLCLLVAVARCVMTRDLEFTTLLPYLGIFAVLRATSVLQTTVFGRAGR